MLRLCASCLIILVSSYDLYSQTSNLQLSDVAGKETLQAGQTAPLTLERVIERFLRSNPSVEVARHRVEVAQGEQTAARLRPNPGLTFSAENLKVSGDTPFNHLYEFSTTLSQTIELGGKRRLRKEVADLAVVVAEAELEHSQRQRLFEIKRAFYEALLTQYALASARENRAGFDELIRFNEVRFREGAIAEGELLKVKLERIKFDSALTQAELSRRQAIIRLLELLGEPDLSAADAVAGELVFTPTPLNLASLKEQALRTRPDIKAAELRASLASRRIDLERARSAMDITPFAGVKRVGRDNTVLFGITIPLRVSDRNQGGIAQAVGEEKIARTDLTLARNRALAEIESAYLAFETARNQVIVFQQELLRQADESHGIALVAYREGATDLLALLEAQRTRADIRQQYYRALFDHQISILQLERAIGRAIQ